MDYAYPAADQTVAKPPRRCGNVRIGPAKAKARRLLRRGAISREVAERHAPDLINHDRPPHDYDRTGIVKGDEARGRWHEPSCYPPNCPPSTAAMRCWGNHRKTSVLVPDDAFAYTELVQSGGPNNPWPLGRRHADTVSR